MILRAAAFSFSLALLLSSSLALASRAAPLPSLGGADRGLRLSIVRYTGGTNGEMIVRVHNPTGRAVAFSAEGLYFVPEGDPEKAPQRLGAAGPFLVQRGADWQSAQSLELAPKSRAELKLQVFCIDSHRPSPDAKQAFRLGSERLPKTLRAQFASGTASALKRYRAMPMAKAAIQRAVWEARDAKWISLDGERKGEKSMKSTPRLQRRDLEQRKIYRLPPSPKLAPRE